MDNSNVSGPVDVRAVIAAVIAELRADGNTGHVQNLLDADAAMARLIDAVKTVRLEANRLRGDSIPSDTLADLDAALANVGPQS